MFDPRLTLFAIDALCWFSAFGFYEPFDLHIPPSVLSKEYLPLLSILLSTAIDRSHPSSCMLLFLLGGILIWDRLNLYSSKGFEYTINHHTWDRTSILYTLPLWLSLGSKDNWLAENLTWTFISGLVISGFVWSLSLWRPPLNATVFMVWALLVYS